jgi:hypothetical protein
MVFTFHFSLDGFPIARLRNFGGEEAVGIHPAHRKAGKL